MKPLIQKLSFIIVKNLDKNYRRLDHGTKDGIIFKLKIQVSIQLQNRTLTKIKHIIVQNFLSLFSEFQELLNSLRYFDIYIKSNNIYFFLDRPIGVKTIAIFGIHNHGYIIKNSAAKSEEKFQYLLNDLYLMENKCNLFGHQFIYFKIS